MTNTNRAVDIPLITITVVEVNEWDCTYKLFHERGARVFKFQALNQTDRWVLTKLTPGKSYAIMQAVAKGNRTHWTGATEYFKSQGKITADVMQQHFANKKAVAHVRQDLLDLIEL